MSRLVPPSGSFEFRLSLVVVLVLFVTGSVFSQNSRPNDTGNRSIVPNLGVLDGAKAGCCGANLNTQSFSPLDSPEYETYRLTATYYTLRDNLTATLMLNNKGPEPILATPTFYSLAGTRLQLAPITVPATSYLDVDMHQLLAGAADEFQEGSMKISYSGISQQLGAQVKLIDAENSLIWAEQFVYTTKFFSSRLENVWWLPYENSETKVVVSNTSSGTLSASLTVDGTSPQQSSPVQITLAPWETRVLDIMRDIAGRQNGHIHDSGGISITHTGNPGAVLARMFISKPNKGYSAAVGFVDPEAAVSSRWHGNGLRLRNINGAKLEPVLVARNSGDQTSRIQGKIYYTNPDGSQDFVVIPQHAINPGKTRIVKLDKLIDDASVPSSVEYGGIELEYDTPKGTVITSVQSVSKNGNHVFQVPMFDPQNMPASAGGFPWKVDGDFTTVVYIKNESDIARKYTAHLIHEGGQYSMGAREIKPRQTVAIDFRELRDSQTPDGMGRIIPPHVGRGQIGWGVQGAENKILSARSEQISVAGGVASTYSCANCCPNTTTSVRVLPDDEEIDVGERFPFLANETEQNCYYQQFGPFAAEGAGWASYNPNIATVDSGGLSEGIGVGDTSIQACIDRVIWYNWGGGYCEAFPNPLCNSAPVGVAPNVTINVPTSADDGSTVTFSSTVAGATPSGYQWEFTTPSGAGNNPTLSFSTATSANTGATAKWFANPNGACTASTSSTYTVKLTVTFSNRGPITKRKSFAVSVPWTTGGITTGSASVPGGIPQVAQNSSGTWYVVSLGTWNLTTSASVQMNVPSASQFYSKVSAHEQHHVSQWAQPNGLLGSNYTNAGLFAAIQNLTDSTQNGLYQKIATAGQNYINTQDATVAGLCNQAEIAAYNVSDLLAPLYLYQRCGATTFSNC